MTLINPSVVDTYLEMTDFPITFSSAEMLLRHFVSNSSNTFTKGSYYYTCIPSTPAGNYTAWAVCKCNELVSIVRYKEVSSKYPQEVKDLQLPYPLRCPYLFIGVAELDAETILSHYTESLVFCLEDIENVLAELQEVEPTIEEIRLIRVYL